MKTKTVPIIDVLTGNAEGTMYARLMCKLAASGIVVLRLRAKLAEHSLSKGSRAELLSLLQQARHDARVAQSTIEVPVKVDYSGAVQ